MGSKRVRCPVSYCVTARPQAAEPMEADVVGEAAVMAMFRVFRSDGTHDDVKALTYGRDGDDWVLYRAFTVHDEADLTGEEAARYPSTDVNGIVLVPSE